MGQGDPSGDRFERVVIVAVAATGLAADLEAVGQGLEDPHHLVDGADPGAANDRPGLAEDADGDALVVEIETDVERGCLLKSMDLENATTGFQVTRLTGASFIVSTPKPPGANHETCPHLEIHAPPEGSSAVRAAGRDATIRCDPVVDVS
jgi:hypothetical protein